MMESSRAPRVGMSLDMLHGLSRGETRRQGDKEIATSLEGDSGISWKNFWGRSIWRQSGVMG